LEASVRRGWPLAFLVLAGCSRASVETEARNVEIASEKELIPAEWTIAEDTSATGEVTTTSLQLPSARHIGGLLEGEAPRLALRCLEGKVAVFIDTAASESDSSSDAEPISIHLDSAPSCE
jgi:hypothetical protein